ncbi:putative methyltransferase-domain-containing protein [Phakopsora pachyrhizi]|nr:putative methyltransferase-domain-containing protein [Phakopsora pachyrhizi]
MKESIIATDKHGDLHRLTRLYAALSPASPRQIPSPPFPTSHWLSCGSNQSKLFDLLIQPEDQITQDEIEVGHDWKLAFWKRVVLSIEAGLRELNNPEEEIDERILKFYISLQNQSNKRVRELRRYYYGPLRDPKLWSRIEILENRESIGHGTTGLKSWGASICLANYLILNPHLIENKSILELGSGTGLLGILVHQLDPSKEVHLTDCNPLVLDRLRHNAHLNRAGENLKIDHLDWNTPQISNLKPKFSKPQVVLAADVIYDPDLVLALVDTICYFLQESFDCRSASAMVCSTVRDPETWELFLSVCS